MARGFALAHLLLGLPWTVGFILGAIVSPPDEMAPLAIARRMQIPRRILVILEGETYHQAAETLGVPVGTVMSRVARARQALRSACADIAHPPAALLTAA